MFCHDRVRRGLLGRDVSRRALSSQGTTLATGAAAPSTVRSGMQCGPVRFGRARPVEPRPGKASSGRVWRVMEPTSCRRGAGSTPAGWD